MNRDEANQLMFEYTKSDALRKHMLAVEAAMRAYARKYGEDEEKWGIVGLLHDFDYEAYPTAPDHPLKGSEILKEKGYLENGAPSISVVKGNSTSIRPGDKRPVGCSEGYSRARDLHGRTSRYPHGKGPVRLR